MSDRKEKHQAYTSGAITIQDSHIENLQLLVYNQGTEDESKRDEAFAKRIKFLCNDLQHSLEKTAKNNSDKTDESCMDIISDLRVSTVPLHIRADEPEEWLDNLGHYHKRNDIINRLKKFLEGDHSYTSPQELLRDAAKLAEKTSAIVCKNDDAKEEYQLRHGNIVGIVGQAGVGKTTYIKQLVENILNPKSNVSSSDEVYIFYFAFRDVNFDIKTTLLEFLTASCGLSNWNTTPEEDLAITNYLAKNENVIILMDGYDEADIPRYGSKCPLVKLDQKASAHVFINNLIGGHVLPFAKKFISSRPRQLYEMDKRFIPKFVVKIVGLDNKGQESIISNVCGEKKEKVKKMFENHPDITAFCRAPLNCILTAYCFNETTDESQTENQHYTITTILVTVIGCFSKNESEKAFSRRLKVKEMSDIAWKMHKAKEFYVDVKTLNDADIKEENVTAFLTTSKGWKRNLSILSRFQTRKVYFSHLLLEEFFVALNIRFFMNAKEFQEIIDLIDGSQYEVISKFLYGMFNRVTIECLKEFLPDCFHSDHLEKEKLSLLKNLIIRKVNSIQTISGSRKKFAIFFQVSSWLYEMKDDEFTQQISLPSTIVISATSILPGEIAPFLYMLKFTKKTIEIKIKKAKFEKNSLDLLLDGLFQISSKIKLTEVELSYVNIGQYDEKMKKLSGCFSHVTNLILFRCHLDTESVKILSNAINLNKIKLQILLLQENGIGDEGAGYISTSVQYIKNLILQNCGITAEGVKKISDGLQRSQSKLQLLILSRNVIGDEGAGYISQSVQYIKSLHLCACGITEAGAKKLSDGLQKSKSKMDELVIFDNKIGDQGFTTVSKVVHKVNKLYIGSPYDQNLTMKGISNLCKEIQNLTMPMEELLISCSDAMEIETEPKLKKLKELTKLKRYESYISKSQHDLSKKGRLF